MLQLAPHTVLLFKELGAVEQKKLLQPQATRDTLSNNRKHVNR